jgi:hypothetical protein
VFNQLKAKLARENANRQQRSNLAAGLSLFDVDSGSLSCARQKPTDGPALPLSVRKRQAPRARARRAVANGCLYQSENRKLSFKTSRSLRATSALCLSGQLPRANYQLLNL